jgi:hypothetical protein
MRTTGNNLDDGPMLKTINLNYGKTESLHAHNSSFISSKLIPGVSDSDTVREITSLLIKYRSPLAAIQLPHFINWQSNLQAISGLVFIPCESLIFVASIVLGGICVLIPAWQAYGLTFQKF